jgi:hypothetical protein
MFDVEYEYSWTDVDLSLRCWMSGGTVEVCQNAFVVPRQINDDIYKEHRSKYWDQDVKTFLDKWQKILGEKYEIKTKNLEVKKLLESHRINRRLM